MTPRPLALSVLAALALTGCGKLGDLERPAPMFGRAPSGQSATDARDPSRSVKTIDPRDESTSTAPPRTMPLDSAPPSPNDIPPQGALPDPYARPQ
jgi:hypothetical protein